MESVINKLARFTLEKQDNVKLFKANLQERKHELIRQYDQSQEQFISNYSHILDLRDLNILENLTTSQNCKDLIIRLKSNITRQSQKNVKLQVRNNRYCYILRELKHGDYFTLERIKQRYPLLFDQYIGESDCNSQNAQNLTLATFLLDHLNKLAHKEKLEQEKHEENVALREIKEKPIAHLRIKGRDSTLGQEFIRKEFFSIIFNDFIEGKEDYANYDQIDNDDSLWNSELDNEFSEDRYFD